MTAQVLSVPRDFTDNKEKDASSFVLTATTGSLVSVSYHTEVARLQSFRNWSIAFINKAELARYGFYYVGPNDMVKCYFCRVEIGLWEPNDNVLSEHLRWSPYCPLLRKRQTNNVPIDDSFLDSLPEPSYDTCGIRIRENSVAENAYSSSDRSSSGSLSSAPSSLTSESSMLSNGLGAQQLPEPTVLPQQKRPEYPNYAIEAKRLESYEDWPKFMKQKPKELSDAGFFYTGKSDRVKCFSCGGGLKDWEAEDEPWEQHAMWYSNCEYLKLMKGEEYIAECLAKKDTPSEQKGSDVGPANSPQPSTSGVTSAETTSLPSSQSSSLSASAEMVNCPTVNGSGSSMEEDETEPNPKSDRTCKICYVNEYNTAFLPCGHVVACAKCASSVTACPLCRKEFTNVMRIYLM